LLTLGHVVVDLCLVFRIVPSAIYPPDSKFGQQITGRFLTYVRRYDIHSSSPEAATGLYLLKRAKRRNGDIMGDIVPLDQVRALVDVVPRFGRKARTQLTMANSMEYSEEFWLNKYFNKELFLSLSL